MSNFPFPVQSQKLVTPERAPTGALPWELARAARFRHCVVIFFPILVTLESKSP
jgi:hypothetical protein